MVPGTQYPDLSKLNDPNWVLPYMPTVDAPTNSGTATRIMDTLQFKK
jgi:hypothetical protein